MSDKKKPEQPIGRKEFFKRTWSGLAGLVYEAFSERLDALDKMFPDRFRPPGALPEAQFRERCVACGDCFQACPHNVIKRELRPGSPEEGLPYLSLRESWCRMCTDFPCILACPTQALQWPEKGLPKIRGKAVVDSSLCLRSDGGGCGRCARICPEPFHAIILPEMGKPPVVLPEKCSGCGWCEAVCPTLPWAIRVETDPKAP